MIILCVTITNSIDTAGTFKYYNLYVKYIKTIQINTKNTNTYSKIDILFILSMYLEQMKIIYGHYQIL